MKEQLSAKNNRDEFEYSRLWEYFKYHAQQRLITFRFFVLIASLIITTLFALFIKITKISPSYASAFASEGSIEIGQNSMLMIMLSISLLLLFHTIIFWILDNRNVTLIDISKSQIKHLENINQYHHKLFNDIDNDKDSNRRLTYKFCFGAIFILFILISCIFITWTLSAICV